MTTMKALTVCQPWAYAIMRLGKEIENRSWPTAHRGELLIHAGKSLEWMEGGRQEIEGVMGLTLPPTRDLAMGAIVGLVHLEDCVRSDMAMARYARQARWINPSAGWGWKVSVITVFADPIPFKGAMGLFDVPCEVVADQLGRRRELAAADEGVAAVGAPGGDPSGVRVVRPGQGRLFG